MRDGGANAAGWRTGWVLALLTWALAGCMAAPSRLSPPPAAQVEPAAQAWPRREVLDLALRAFRCGAREGRFPRPLLTVIDYSLPSTERRLWVIDLRQRRVLHQELVAHGDRSGDTMAVAFSNERDSHQSSLGLFRTDEAYTGSYGYSLRLTGLEPGVNDNARARAIVVHGASYVSRATIAQYGRIGTTWGCPGLPEDVAPQVIDEIAGGSAIFAYYPEQTWLRTSRYLHCDGSLASASDADALLAGPGGG
ncbi:murein L,D-transpeptidase catalytic domain family protein [bacterium]|nr:murein L,D-transpeptidase catalytic domain family protein [bacterium]